MTRDILVDPPLPVSFGDSPNHHTTTLKVSRIIWMAPKE